MKISSLALLRIIFGLKGNFKEGYIPQAKTFNGVEVAPLKYGAKAAVCISADFELNWAWRELDAKTRDFMGGRARKNFGYILDFLEAYEIPVTWATVGHLFLSQCKKGKGGLPHRNLPRPSINRRWEGDWYLHDPCSNFVENPLWYAPDLIKQIIESDIPHEIGTHSFSHIEFSTKCSDNALVRSEILKCKEVMRSYGLKPRSLVFPFNIMGCDYFDVLSELGITAVRYRDSQVRLSYPERTSSGIYKIYESMNLRTTTFYDYWVKAKIFLEEAAERYAVYHHWFHPSDPLSVFKNEFRCILEQISKYREKGIVWVTTMGELAAYCEARRTVDLKVLRQNNELTIFVENSFDLKRYGPSEVTIIIQGCGKPYQTLIDHEDVSERRGKNKPITNRGNDLLMNFPITAKCLLMKFKEPLN